MSASETNWGVGGSKHHTPAEVDEHAIVDGVHAKKTFPIDLPPTAQTNPSLTLFNADAVVASTKTLTMTIGATSYVSTLSYNASNEFLSMSVWSEV